MNVAVLLAGPTKVIQAELDHRDATIADLRAKHEDLTWANAALRARVAELEAGTAGRTD